MVNMSVKQSSPGVLCRCINCHGVFKLFSYRIENDKTYSEFDCDCGRVIKIEETKTHLSQGTPKSSSVQPACEEVRIS